MRCLLQKRQIEERLFLFLVFFLPLVCVLLMRQTTKYGMNTGTLLLYGVEGATPMLSTVLVIGICRGRKELESFLWEKYVKNLSIGSCLLGFAVPALVYTLGKALTYLTPVQHSFWNALSGKKLLIIAWALLAEELGWRGYLQERLERRLRIMTPVVIGLIWALWHYHFFLSGSMDQPVLLFVLGCVMESCGYLMITRLAGGNVIPASLWHFSGNLFFNLYRLGPSWNEGSLIPYVIVTALQGIYVVGYVVAVRRTRSLS